MITSSLVMSWGPCPDYTRERVAKFFAGRESLTPQEVAVLDIPLKDIIWTLLAWLESQGHDKILHGLACAFALRALEREHSEGREPDPRSWAAVEVKMRWMRGEATDEELTAAESAAWDAAGDTPRYAAWAAAWAAAGSTVCDARTAAWNASRDAARTASWNAARGATRDAARDIARGAARDIAWDVAWTARDIEARHQITMILEVTP